MTKPIPVSMFLGALVLLGLYGLPSLPLSLLPNTEYPGLTIQTEYPGVTPDKIEEVLTRPLEDVVKTVGAVESIESASEEGKSRVNILFVPGTDVKTKSVQVRAQVDLIRGGFPREVQEPQIFRYDP